MHEETVADPLRGWLGKRFGATLGLSLSFRPRPKAARRNLAANSRHARFVARCLDCAALRCKGATSCFFSKHFGCGQRPRCAPLDMTDRARFTPNRYEPQMNPSRLHFHFFSYTSDSRVHVESVDKMGSRALPLRVTLPLCGGWEQEVVS